MSGAGRDMRPWTGNNKANMLLELHMAVHVFDAWHGEADQLWLSLMAWRVCFHRRGALAL